MNNKIEKPAKYLTKFYVFSILIFFSFLTIISLLLAKFEIEHDEIFLTNLEHIEEDGLSYPKPEFQKTNPPTHTTSSKLIYYNRVPKCASTLMIDLLKATSQKYNNFQITNFHYRGISFLTKKGSKDEVNFLNTVENVLLDRNSTLAPNVYIRHQYYVDLEEALIRRDKSRTKKEDQDETNLEMSSLVNLSKNTNTSSIAYINILRDPIERFISSYYFSRFGSDVTINLKSLNKATNVNPKYINETVEECIKFNRPECQEKTFNNLMTKFFCGREKFCFGDEEVDKIRAIELAKSNLVKVYKVVGIYEELELSVKLMEANFPEVFSGIYSVYLENFVRQTGSSGAIGHQKTKTKKIESEATKEILRKYLKYDVELYELAKQVFEGKIKEYGIS